jgi:hypothetical protein
MADLIEQTEQSFIQKIVDVVVPRFPGAPVCWAMPTSWFVLTPPVPQRKPRQMRPC